MNNKDRIVAVALRAFIERGYDAVSMKEIAAAVPMKAASIYYHFKDKRALFEACANLFFDRWSDWLAGLGLEDADLRGVIRTICASLGADSRIIRELYGADTRAGQYKLILDVLAVCPAAMARMKAANDRFHGLLSAKVREAGARGEIRKEVGSDAVYYLLGGLLEGSNVMRFTDGEMDGRPEGDRIAEIIWNGIKATDG